MSILFPTFKNVSFLHYFFPQIQNTESHETDTISVRMVILSLIKYQLQFSPEVILHLLLHLLLIENLSKFLFNLYQMSKSEPYM